MEQMQSSESESLGELLFVVQEGSNIIKQPWPDSAQNKQTTFFTKTRIRIKLDKLEKCPEIINLQSSTYSD